MFYALTQATAALCAARITEDPWEPIPSHGLTLLKPVQRHGRTPSLRELDIREQGRGFVHQAAHLLDSPVLSDQVGLAALLCSLPDHTDFLLLDGYEDLLRPLTVHDGTLMLHDRAEPSSEVEAVVGPLPADLERSEHINTGSSRRVPPSVDEIVEWFSAYPTLAGAGRPLAVDNVQPMQITRRNPDYLVRVRWELPKPIEWGKSNVWLRSIVDIVDNDEPGVPAQGTVLPAVGGNGAPQHPLVTWWIILYACSMLARYHPRVWVALLDVDKSPSAVQLDRVLQSAHSRLPMLLADEILAERVRANT